MYTVTCKECNLLLEAELKGKQLKRLAEHIKTSHGISSLEYVKKHFCNNVIPKCACGCGTDVEFRKWKFYKFYKDHKNHMPMSDSLKEKQKFRLESNLVKYPLFYDGILTKEKLVEILEDYKKPEFNEIKIKEKYAYDFRTISKYWIFLGVISYLDLKNLKRLHKAVYSNKGEKNGSYRNIPEDTLFDIYSYIMKHKNKVTIKKIRSIFRLKLDHMTIYKKLVEKFGKEDLQKNLKLGRSSKPEKEFGYVLDFYFGHKNVYPQFYFKGRYFDFLLFDKILVEYDGEYWHSKPENIVKDRIKDEIALNNNYIMFRVKEKDAMKIETLTKLKEICDEVNSKKNQ